MCNIDVFVIKNFTRNLMYFPEDLSDMGRSHCTRTQLCKRLLELFMLKILTNIQNLKKYWEIYKYLLGPLPLEELL